jgi:hypothetical protein
VSRGGAPAERERAGAGAVAPAAGTPIWVGVLYFLGALGALGLGFLVALKLVEALFWESAPDYDVSVPLVVLWTAVVVAAVVVWARRRR